MKKIEKDELFQNLKEFLGVKGIRLTEGVYSQTIQKSCRILADVINMGQQGIERAKTGIDTKLEKVRRAIHEKTAPQRVSKRGATPPQDAANESKTFPNENKSAKERTPRAKRPSKPASRKPAVKTRARPANKATPPVI